MFVCGSVCWICKPPKRINRRAHYTNNSSNLIEEKKIRTAISQTPLIRFGGVYFFGLGSFALFGFFENCCQCWHRCVSVSMTQQPYTLNCTICTAFAGRSVCIASLNNKMSVTSVTFWFSICLKLYEPLSGVQNGHRARRDKSYRNQCVLLLWQNSIAVKHTGILCKCQRISGKNACRGTYVLISTQLHDSHS